MSPLDKTVKCPICGRPYKRYAFSAADQSACPKCVREAGEAEGGYTTTGDTHPTRFPGGDDE